MNFVEGMKKAKEAYSAFLNGIISEEEYERVLLDEAVVTYKGSFWRYEPECFLWLWYDDINKEWIERKAPVENEEELVVSLDEIERIKEYPDKKDQKEEVIEDKNEENKVEEVKEESKIEELKKENKETKKKFCFECGEKLNVGAKFCQNCGTKQ